MFVILSRSYGEKQTMGCLAVFDEDTLVYLCKTLELPYLENHKNISCIPPGEYKCERVTSQKFGICFLVKDVPNRSGILFHSGNFTTDTEGCIIPGLHFFDLNNDDNIDIANSTTAMNMLRVILPQRFKLIII